MKPWSTSSSIQRKYSINFSLDASARAFYGKCISSRHFDAAGTKTCQIMFRGRFNDILNANEHYLALEPDFSNIDDVLAAFRDPVRRQHVADAAYDLVRTKHTYAQRMQQVYDLLAASGQR